MMAATVIVKPQRHNFLEPRKFDHHGLAQMYEANDHRLFKYTPKSYKIKTDKVQKKRFENRQTIMEQTHLYTEPNQQVETNDTRSIAEEIQ